METKEQIKQKKINEHELQLEEVLYNPLIDDPDWSKHLAEKTLLGWIELIENSKLHQAVKSLPVEDQIFLSYIIKEQRTQRELAKLYKIDHRTIGRRFEKITKKIENFYKKGRM